jgi:hypothetical protein
VPLDPTGARGPTRNQAAGPRWRRTSQGLYVPSFADGSVPEQRILEASMLLPAGGAVDAWAALRLARAAFFDGLLPDGVTERPVPLGAGPRQARRHRPGISWARDVLDPSEVWVRYGIPCLRPTPALFNEMRRSEDLRAAVIALDMACAAEVSSISRTRTHAEAHPRADGVPLVRAALLLADEDSWSPGESRLRLVWVLDARRPTPLCNREVFDVEGRSLGVADLLDTAAGVVGEYDGAEHARPGRRSRDAAKDSALRDAGLEVFRVTAHDLHDVGSVVHRIHAAYARAALGRPARRWTLERPRGREARLSLDQRIELKQILGELQHHGG